MRDSDLLARRSLWMLAVFAGAYLVAAMVGGLFMQLLDVREGDLLLSAGGFGGWAAEIVVNAILVAPPFVGIVFALHALQRRATAKAWTAFALHSLLLLWILYIVADDITMTYFPGG